MTDQSKIFTLGPADPKAPLAAKAYTVVSSILSLVTLAATFNLVTTDQAGAINGVAAAGVGLVGAVTTAIAAFRTRKQISNGTFDAAPPPPSTPVLDAFQAVDAIKTHVDQTVDQAQAKVAEGVAAMQNAAALLPGGTVVTDAVMASPVGDLLRAVTATGGKG